MSVNDLSLDISQEILVKAAPEVVFRSVLRGLAEDNAMPDGRSLQLKIEPWPGGRWFRDLGGEQGHLWGFVQVIKPPTLLEFSGPMMMSYPATNHVQFRLTPADGVTKIAFRHRALGLIDPAHREGFEQGWNHIIKHIKEISER